MTIQIDTQYEEINAKYHAIVDPLVANHLTYVDYIVAAQDIPSALKDEKIYASMEAVFSLIRTADHDWSDAIKAVQRGELVITP